MRPAAVLLVVALATPAAAQAPAPPIQVKYTQFTLPNGMRVILHEDHSVPLVTVNTWYRAGSANEMPGRTGFAHLFEHLMFMGSGHAPYGEFDSQLESVGGGNNASTANDRTNYYIDVPSNALELALFFESDRMGYLLDAMNPKTVDAQRDVVKKKMYESGAPGRAALTPENYLFEEGAVADGLSAVAVTPRRKDILLIDGSIFLRPEDGDLVRIEGRLSKTPSFWIRHVQVVRSYQRIAGARMPVAVEAVANIRLAGKATFKMTYEYETVNGRRIGAPEPRLAKAVATD